MIKREDVLLLIASLVIAIGLWFQVQPMFEPGREREFIVPLKLQNKPDELAVFPATDNVTLIASGTLADLDKLDASRIVAFIDLKDAKPGESRIQVEIQSPADSGVEIKAKSPSIAVSSEFILRIEKPITIVTSGTPPEGLILSNTVSNPSVVELYGPSSYVKQVVALQANIDLSKIKPGQSLTVPVAPIDSKGNPVPSTFTSPAQVTVAASFIASMATRDVAVIVDYRGQAASNYEIQEIIVAPARIEIKGKSENVSSITTIDTEEIDLSGISSNRQLKVKLVSPNDVQLSVSEVTVTVKVKRR